MKILFLTHRFYPCIGGIETVSALLANAFHNDGHEVHLLTWQEGKIGDEFLFTVMRRPNLISLIKEHAWADVVFENNPCLQLSWPGMLFKKPFIVALHTWISRVDGTIGWKDRVKLKWWLKRAKRVVAVSKAIGKVSWPIAEIIGNPYDANLFRRISFIKKTSDFIFLGRLVSDKGVDIAIKAFHKLKTLGVSKIDSDNLSFTIVGDGPEKERLSNMALKLGLDKCIHFVGVLQGERLVECLNRHRFILIPSVWEEPFGLVALEGIACGCIPIASDGGGLPDAVGKAGVIFKRGNIDAFFDVLCKVIHDTDLENQYRNAGEEHLKRFKQDVVAEKYLQVIKGAVNS
ncbi:glycosyltransferase family 4 protein [Flavisolibacter tropicus]|uniref:Glycosyl transferase group 1 n=1 Tax=Flavisolibacter tropicus TaxID=1492898 RepID=A0A172TQF3_9BACT|nr:glycosyltransferase family 4 protein [Flavisolibacter tropicus]ANE49260.1 glycosyl transferase group 1 [Flavisolibacter tropicus]